MKYEVLNHACVKLQGSVVVYADPFGLTVEMHDADLILITHDHYDHLSPDDIAKAAKQGTVVVVPASVNYSGAYRAVKLAPGEQTELCGVGIEAVPAYNINKKFHPKENGWLGYVVTLDGVRYYIAGDTDDTPEARTVKCDIAFPCVDGNDGGDDDDRDVEAYCGFQLQF